MSEEHKTFFVDCIVPLSIPQYFTYRVPFDFNNLVAPGMRVIVPFGRKGLLTAVIKKVHETPPEKYTAKYLDTVLDDTPLVSPMQLQFWSWLGDYYMAAPGEVMMAALPGSFRLASESKYLLHPDFEKNYDALTDREFLVVEALEIREVLTYQEITEILGIKTVQPVIKTLIEKRALIIEEELKEKYTAKYEPFIRMPELEEQRLHDVLDGLQSDARAVKQNQAVLIYLSVTSSKTGKWVLKKDLIRKGASDSSIATLVKKEIFEEEFQEVNRLTGDDLKVKPSADLNEEQEFALEQIRGYFQNDKEVVLLHGVTSSGKTEVYVKLIEDALKNGEQILFLLPEIALTTQLIERLKKYFGNTVGVYHSKFNSNERVEIWSRVSKNNKDSFRIILGARSSLFLPFYNLGLIIVDEEHENTFKQFDPAPRYNARDSAIVLAYLSHAKVLLGSATPSLESYYNAKNEKYGFVEMKKRFGGVKMPEMLTADLREESRNKTMTSHFSSLLLDEIKRTLSNKEQVILFQNRRGYAPSWLCEDCGWTPYCKNCDVSTTYHKLQHLLKCHYCGYQIPPPKVCEQCGSSRIKMVGFGTEKIEDELQELIPEVKISRLDLDTTRSKNAYRNILEDFENGDIDIMVGTQMVTKGLDFDHVGLVGVLNADALLNFPDFRAFERSFQLMEQVSGRAGRKEKQGKVVIQTHNPNHWIIQKVIEHNYEGMYEAELVERKNFNYPPFFKIIVLTLKHSDYKRVHEAAKMLHSFLFQVFKNRVLGPEPPLIARVRNKHLVTLTLKIEKEASPRKVKAHLKEQIDKCKDRKVFNGVIINIDVDPV